MKPLLTQNFSLLQKSHEFLGTGAIISFNSFSTMCSFPSVFAVLAWLAYLTTSAMAANINTTSIPFRIMSLGASVSFGIGSTTGDSYRKDLQDLLVANSNTIEYVGTENNGNFSDNAVEATPGFVISQIAAAANAAVSYDLREGIYCHGNLS
jgi:hypothetical protein